MPRRRSKMVVGRLLHITLMVIYRLLQKVALVILSLYRSAPNDALVPIRDDCLLQSAKFLAARIRSRKITSKEAVTACINRVKEINKTTNCLVEDRFREALQEAEEVDKLLSKGTKSIEQLEKETPFLGVPFTVKDGIAIEGLPHVSGTVARKDIIAKEDADAVKLLRASGAIPIGTTNVPEMIMWWESSNHVYGRTNNPYHSQYSVGGSSGGEAAIIAAAGSMMGLGSDVGGSVRIPSNCCGTFGHKPSAEVVPFTGHFPEAKTQNRLEMNNIGPITKFAEDLMPMMKVLAAGSKDRLRLDEPVDVTRLRYYYIEDSGSNPWLDPVDPVHPEVKETLMAVVKHFQKVHGLTVEKVNFDELAQCGRMWWAKLMGENGPQLRKAMAGGEGQVNLWCEALKALIRKSDHTMEMIVMAAIEERSGFRDEEERKEWLERGQKLTKKFEKLLGDDGVIFYPTLPMAPFKHSASLISPFNFAYTAVFNLTQMPATQCPIRQTKDGLPIGIQVAAAKYQDRLTIAVAEELEKAFGGWKPPPSQPK